jgi:hypothetical protein
MKAQVEASFQWIYVILAGGAMLVMFFFVLRSCTQTGGEQVSSSVLRSTGTVLSSSVWQEQTERNVTMPELSVICTAGTLTLSQGDAAFGLDNAPMFLSPELDGRTRLASKDLYLATTPTLRYGSVLYAISQQTQYYIFKDPALRHEKIAAVLGRSANVRYIDNVNQILATEDPIVIVRFDSLSDQAAAAQRTSGKAYWLTITATELQFYEKQASAFVPTGKAPVVGDLFTAGAAVSGRFSLYRCSRANIAGRMQKATAVYAERSTKLSSDSADACKPKQAAAASELVTMQALDPDAYIARALSSTVLSDAQRYLYENRCPVIA